MKDAKAITMKNGKPAVQGVCPTCGTKMLRIGALPPEDEYGGMALTEPFDELVGQPTKLIDLVLPRRFRGKQDSNRQEDRDLDALVHIIDGEAEVSISSRPIRLKQGETIIMPANEPHSLRALKRFKMMLAMIRS